MENEIKKFMEINFTIFLLRPIRKPFAIANKQSSDGLSGLPSVERLNNNAANSSCTNDRKSLINMPSKSSSLELILTPIIQSRR